MVEFDFATSHLILRSIGMKSKTRKLLDYPDQTRGSKLAAEVRKKANGLSPKQRAEYFRKGMAMIYGGDGTKEASRT